MHVIATGVLVTTFVLMGAAASAQTADEIIQKGECAQTGHDRRLRTIMNAARAAIRAARMGSQIL